MPRRTSFEADFVAGDWPGAVDHSDYVCVCPAGARFFAAHKAWDIFICDRFQQDGGVSVGDSRGALPLSGRDDHGCVHRGRGDGRVPRNTAAQLCGCEELYRFEAYICLRQNIEGQGELESLSCCRFSVIFGRFMSACLFFESCCGMIILERV